MPEQSYQTEPPPAEEGAFPGNLSIRVVMMPKDTNALGTIFGGIILSYIDLAGAIEGHRHVKGKLVTVAMREVEFLAPVHVGDLVTFYTETRKVGRTSLTVGVVVEAERRFGALEARYKVTEAEVVYVHVDEDRNPVPILSRAAD